MNDMSIQQSSLNIPFQSAPIDRTPAGAAAFSNVAGVEAAGWLDDVLGGVQKVAGVAGPLLSSFGV